MAAQQDLDNPSLARHPRLSHGSAIARPLPAEKPLHTPDLSSAEAGAVAILRQNGDLPLSSRSFNRADLEAGLKRFQSANGLESSNGQLDEATRQKLIEKGNEFVKNNPNQLNVSNGVRALEVESIKHRGSPETRAAAVTTADKELTDAGAALVRAIYKDDMVFADRFDGKRPTNEQLIGETKRHLMGEKRDADGNLPNGIINERAMQVLKERAEKEMGGESSGAIKAALEKFESAYKKRNDAQGFASSTSGTPASDPMSQRQTDAMQIVNHIPQYKEFSEKLAADGVTGSKNAELTIRKLQDDVRLGRVPSEDLESRDRRGVMQRNSFGQQLDTLRANGFSGVNGQIDDQTLHVLQLLADARIARVQSSANHGVLSADAQTHIANLRLPASRLKQEATA